MTNQDRTQASKLTTAAEGVFLTPRVLDQRAFEELSGAIRSMITEAVDRGQNLSKASAEVRGMTETVRQTASALHARMETAAKLIPILDQMIKGAQTANLPDETMLTMLAAKAVDRALSDRKDVIATPAPAAPENGISAHEVERQVAAATGAIEARLAESERSNAERMSAIEAMLSERAYAAATQNTRTNHDESLQIAGRIERGVEAARAMVEQASHATRQLDEVRGQADRVRLGLGEELIQAAARADAVSKRVAELNREVDAMNQMVQQTRALCEESTRSVAGQWPQLREMASAATDTITAAEDSARERLAELEREVQAVRASIASVVAAESPKLHELAEAQQRVRTQIEQTVRAADRVEKFSMERLAELRELETTIAGVRTAPKPAAFVPPPIARGGVMTEVKSTPSLKISGSKRGEGKGESRKIERTRAVKLKRKSA